MHEFLAASYNTFSQLDTTTKWMIFFATYFVIMAAVYTFFLITASISILSRFGVREAEDIHSLLKSDSLPPITFIVPAFNEAKDIVTTVRTMLNVFYRYKEIIVVNDGSTDATLEILIQNFALYKVPPLFQPKLPTQTIRSYYKSREHPELLIIDKVNGGKADALNAGLNASTSELHVCTDADTLIDNQALPYLIRPFLENPITLVVSSGVCIANGCQIAENRIVKYGFPKKLLVGFQAVEYLKTIFLDRVWLDWSRGALVVPGAFGLFKSSAVIEIGGYSKDSMVEDMEIIMRMHKYMLDHKRDYHVTFIPEPVAWTEAPETLHALYKQRKRWYPGTFHCLWDYMDMCFKPRYKSIGMIVIPYYLFDRIGSPIIEVGTYVIVAIGMFYGNYSLYSIALFALFAWGIMTILTFFCILVEELTFRQYADFKSLYRLVIAALLDNMFYHFLILSWKISGMFFTRLQVRTWHGTPREGYEKISNKHLK